MGCSTCFKHNPLSTARSNPLTQNQKKPLSTLEGDPQIKSIHWKAKIWQATVSALKRHTKWTLIMKYRAGLGLSFSCLHITQSKNRLSQMLPDTAAGKAGRGLLHPTSETSTHVLPISSTEEWKHFWGGSEPSRAPKGAQGWCGRPLLANWMVLHYLGQKR